MRQVGGMVVGTLVFLAIVAAMSRLLTMKEMPAYIDNVANGLTNLFRGAFGR